MNKMIVDSLNEMEKKTKTEKKQRTTLAHTIGKELEYIRIR